MAVTKRLRFEILRRDEYTCRYCHRTNVPLAVDHVVPVALGGSDEPSNLVAACTDCNGGKSSIKPDDALVADVRDDALRYAELTRQAYAVLVEEMGKRDEYIDAFCEAFPGQPVPADWRTSVGRWFEMGVPIELVADAAQIALDSPLRFNGSGRFKYLCGVVWNKVRLVDDHVRARTALDGAWRTDAEIDDEVSSAWAAGHRGGDHRARREMWNLFGHHIWAGVTLESFVDRSDVGADMPWMKGARDGA